MQHTFVRTYKTSGLATDYEARDLALHGNSLMQKYILYIVQYHSLVYIRIAVHAHSIHGTLLQSPTNIPKTVDLVRFYFTFLRMFLSPVIVLKFRPLFIKYYRGFPSFAIALFNLL